MPWREGGEAAVSARDVVLTPPGWPRPRLPDRHGIRRPVPWITQAPEFASMEPNRGRASILGRLCQVCGEGHESGADVVIFLDGRLRDRKTRGELQLRRPAVNFLHMDVALKALDQAIMHERCARLAAGACPQLQRMHAEGRLFAFVGPLESIEHDTDEKGAPTKVYMHGPAARPWDQLPLTDADENDDQGGPVKYQIFPGKDGDHYWRQLGENGEELARSSEGYSDKEGAERALRTSQGDVEVEVLTEAPEQAAEAA